MTMMSLLLIAKKVCDESQEFEFNIALGKQISAPTPLLEEAPLVLKIL